MSVKDINALLVMVSLALFAAVYFLLYTPMLEETDTLTQETERLKPRLDTLLGYEKELPTYAREIEAAEELMSSVIDSYPVSVRTEDVIMYAVDIENRYQMQFDSISFSEPWSIRQFDRLSRSGRNVERKPTDAYSLGYAINGSFSYGQLKDFLRETGNPDSRTTLDQLSISYNSATGLLSGTMNLVKYYISDGTEPYVATVVPGIRYGTDDLFGTILPTEAANADVPEPSTPEMETP